MGKEKNAVNILSAKEVAAELAARARQTAEQAAPGCGCQACACHTAAQPDPSMLPVDQEFDAEDLRKVRHHG